MSHDVRFALRSLARSPGFAFVAVASLALGIGANTAVFSLLYQVAIRSLPVDDPSRMVSLQSDGRNLGWTHSDNNRSVFSYPMYTALRDNNQVLVGLIGRAGAQVTLGWGGEATHGGAEVITGNYFAVLGVKPALGRLLTPEDEVRENPVAVLSYAYWADRLARDPKVLNSRMLMNGQPVVVVGVAARGFRGVMAGQSPEIFAPVSLMPVITPGWRKNQQVDVYWLNLFARLKPEISPARAQAGLLPLFRATFMDHMERSGNVGGELRKEWLARPLRVEPASQGINTLRDRWESPLLIVFAMVGSVLLIACANVAGLMVVRATARQREIAVRFALGASRWQIARQLMVESLLLALAGCVLSLFVCGALTSGLLRLLPEDVAGGWLIAETDFRLFAFSLALGVATGVLFGLIPAVRALRTGLAPALKEQGVGLTGAGHGFRARQAFVAAQICLSLALVAGAGLFMRTLVNLTSTDPGFQPDHLITFSLDPSLSGQSRPQALALGREIEGRLHALGPVKSVARAAFAPFDRSGWGNGVKAPGTRAAGDKYVSCSANAVGAGYFQTLGVPLIAGREFSAHDAENAPKLAILNETLARFLFEDANPIGRHVVAGSNEVDMEVVGVVKDSKAGDVRERPQRFLYVSHDQNEDDFVRQFAVFIRTRADERQVMAAVRGVVRQTAPGVPILRMDSMSAMIVGSVYRERLMASLAVVFGALATILAAVGLYGAISYSTALRTREFGIRLALGAGPRSMLELVLREAAFLVGIGLAAGLALSWAVAGLVRSQLYGVAAHDPWTLAGAALLIAAVAGCAALKPSLRAMRIDPVRALRSE